MVTVNELLESMGIETSGMPRGTSASGNLGLQEDIFAMLGNPLFQLQQGLMTPEEFQQNMSMLASDVIPTDEVDFDTLEQNALTTGEDILIEAYDLIKKGFTSDQVIRSLLDALGARDVSSIDERAFNIQRDKINNLKADVELFKQRWDAANALSEGMLSGTVFQGVDGSWYRQKDPEEARKAYAAAGLPDYLQNPFLWRTVPDPTLLAEAAKGDERAKSIAEDLNRMVDPNGVFRRPADRAKVTDAAARAGEEVYRNILGMGAAGKARQEQVDKSKERSDYELGMFGPTASSRAAAAPPVARSSQQQTTAAGMQNLAKWIANKSKEAQAASQTSAAILNRVAPTAQAQDMWAKMGGSYAARAAAEEARKPITDLRAQLVAAQKAAADKRTQAMQQGTIPAMKLLQEGAPLAALLSTPQPKAAPAKPKPRVLSDQEIETMANMIAGGTI